MAPELHTPLESLLLFQTLHPYNGTDAPSFANLSQSLKTNDLLHTSASSERLEPESLKSLYLAQLKEEARVEAGQVLHNDGGQSPRKRKRSSPVLDTVEQAQNYRHLMPQLVNRLYFRYRDHAIKTIEDEERRSRTLQREIQEIERGEWDSRLQPQASPKQESRRVSSIQNLLQKNDGGEGPQVVHHSRPTSSGDLRNGHDAKAQRASSTEPAANGYIQSPQLDNDQRDLPNSLSTDSGVPFLPPRQPPTGYPSGSPSSDINRRLPPLQQSQPYPAPLPSPHAAQSHLPPPERRSSASPIILPPLKHMHVPSASPPGPLDALADMAGQQYRASPTMPSPSQFPKSAPQQHTQYPPSRVQTQRPHIYYENQAAHQMPYSPFGQGPVSAYNQQHPTMPPYQATTAGAGHASPYGNTPPYQSPPHTYPPQSGYAQPPAYYQQASMQTPFVRGQVQRFTDLHTPVPAALNKQRPPKPSPIFTSASSTRWKDTPGSVRQHSPVPPSSRDISPLSDRAPSPSPEVPKTRTSSQKGHLSSIDSPSAAVAPRTSRGGRRGRARGARAGNLTSFNVAGSNRGHTCSQSITPQADEISHSNRKASTYEIKPEPSVASAREDETSIASHTADEGTRKPGRLRRGTTRKEDQAESIRSSAKRKRDETSMLPPPSPSPVLVPLSRPGYVLGTRNFPRTSATLMNEVVAHKVANIFAKPLTEREAPGYKDLIYCPQDLKSIKAAIKEGNKSLIAAAETMGEDRDPQTVWVPESPDFVPPKGIINSAQLEQELMRMFANAIMYNPDLPTNRGIGPAFRTRARTAAGIEEGEDTSEEVVEKHKEDRSVVKDTREMFDHAALTMENWRSAERATEGGRVGRLRGGGEAELELAGGGEGNEIVRSVEMEGTPEPKAKRRRK